MMNFNKGEYVVLLSYPSKDCKWENSMPLNYCYILDRNTNKYEFGVEKDINNMNNGWFLSEDNIHAKEYNNLLFRKATDIEIKIYNIFDFPFEVSEIEIIKNKNHNYLIKLLKKLNIK